MVDKLRALQLRESGSTHKQIADELGCSVDWCKQNLRGVKKYTNEETEVKGLILQATSKDAITTGDIKRSVRSLYPLDSSKESKELDVKAIRRFRGKVMLDSKSVVRPYWMQPKDSKLSLNLLLSAVNLVDEYVFEQVNHIRKELNLDTSYIKSLTFAINQLTYAGSMSSNQPITEVLENLTNIAEELERRNS